MTIEQAIAFHRAGRFAEAENAYRSLLAADPRDPDALHFYGVLRGQGGDFAAAADLIGRSLAIDPDAPQAHFHIAGVLAHLGRKDEALTHYQRALALQPGFLQAQLGRIGVLIDLGRGEEALALCRNTPPGAQLADLRGRALMLAKAHAEALAAFDSALALKSDFAEAHYDRAQALHALARNGEALAALDQAIALRPDFAEAHLVRGIVFLDLDKPQEALAAIDAALALRPDLAEVHRSRADALNRLKRWGAALEAGKRAVSRAPQSHDAQVQCGRALLALKRPEEALAAFDRAAALRPDVGECHNARGSALIKLGRAEEALSAFDRALALEPESAIFLANRASTLAELGRMDEALDGFARALARAPDSVDATYNLANTLMSARRTEEALAAFDSALALKPDFAVAHYNRCRALEELGRNDDAMAACERALALDPNLALAQAWRFFEKARNCDWHGREAEVADLKRLCERGDLISPFAVLAALDDPVAQLKAGRAMAGPQRPHVPFAPRSHDRLRVGYLSPDFHDHPVANQIVELLEHHDRSRFEVSGICVNAGPDSAIRRRIKDAFEHFHEAGTLPNAALARLLERLEIDIAVDLAGWTDKGRTSALSYRPAPIAVSYLGFSGTTGADYVDYIVADSYVIRPDDEQFFSEKIVRLPHCFFPTDSTGRNFEPKPARAEEGLPEDGFVFCTFNSSFKITPEMFDVWMRLLKAVEGSVLWLRTDKPAACNNLRLEAERRGVSPDRMIFGDRAPRERHLARIALADLFLDSTPYNAHTTANDALWAGLPLVTCLGNSFASRVAASMLTVAKAEELIAPDLAAYESLALSLARSPERLAALRQGLVAGRAANPLFDTKALTRQLERAFETMWEIHTKGQKPRGFSVNMDTAADGAPD